VPQLDLTASWRAPNVRLSQGSHPALEISGAKAESVARERGRPVEPDPGNAGEGMQLQKTLAALVQLSKRKAYYEREQEFLRTEQQ